MFIATVEVRLEGSRPFFGGAENRILGSAVSFPVPDGGNGLPTNMTSLKRIERV